MATLNEAEAAFALTLEINDIPTKLRCGICNKLAVNAVKLPCCETSICDKCQEQLSEQCPVCEHQPVSPDVCTPIRSLRMTVKAHLKTEMKKRAAQASVVEVPTPAVEPTPTPVPVDTSQATVAPGAPVADTSSSEIDLESGVPPVEEPSLGHDGSVAQTIEEGDAAQAGETQGELAAENAEDEETEDDDDKSDVEIITERPELEMQENSGPGYGQEHIQHQQQEQDMSQMNGQQDFSNGFNQNQQQGFGNMDFNSMPGFNPMVAMQNMGMSNFSMGGMPNMMGMAGMMDPSMTMNQFGGMGDMNMNMMASMMNGGGSYGQMNGGYGNANANAGGYNRFGNAYNQPQQQMPFHQNARGFNRPYGRGGGFRGGRGAYGFNGRGRGGFNQFGQGYQQNGFQQNGFQNGYQNGMQQQQQDFPQPQQNEESAAESGARRGSPVYDAMRGAENDSGDANVQPRETTEAQDSTDQAAGDDTNTGDGDTGTKIDGDNTAPSQSAAGAESVAEIIADATQTGPANDDAPQPVQAFYGHPSQPYGFQDQGPQGNFNGPSAYGNFHQGSQTPAVAPPVNAPTGPKAMRQGLPNSGIYSRPQVSQTPSNMNGKPPSEQPASVAPGSVRGRSVEKDGYDREASRSKSRHRSKKHRRDEEDYESDATYERRKEKERKKRKDRERDARDGARSNGRARSRSASPGDDSSSRRYRHRDDDKRSRRDRSRDKRKSSHREDNDDDDSASRRKSKSHRSRDDDDHARGDKDKSSRRSSRRDPDDDRKDKDRSSKHSRHPSRDRSSRTNTAPEQPSDEIGFKIKGSHSNKINPRGMPPPASTSRRDSERSIRRESVPETTTTASADPYAEERERHKKERALKEQQRRQSSSSVTLGKRSRDEEGDAGRKRRGRQISAKYEGEIGDGEREREAGRWR